MLIVKKSLSDQIYDVLKMEILNGKIEFGDTLVNRQLQTRFGVSSTPIRDAINRLYNDGLVDNISRTGAAVIEFDLTFAVEVNEVLMYIVQNGMDSSFRKSDPETIYQSLIGCIQRQKKHLGTDRYFEHDYRFHKTFIDFSCNSRMITLFKKYNVLTEVLVRSFYNPENTVEKQRISIQTHNEIAELVRKGEIEQAIEINRVHYKIAEQLFIENLNQ